MTVHVAHINALHMSPADFAAAKERDRLIREMADHLLAGVTANLDLDSDFDVIRYLKTETPEQYRASVITTHMDAAKSLARETIEAAREGLRCSRS